jgi:hypothetical protein
LSDNFSGLGVLIFACSFMGPGVPVFLRGTVTTVRPESALGG